MCTPQKTQDVVQLLASKGGSVCPDQSGSVLGVIWQSEGLRVRFPVKAPELQVQSSVRVRTRSNRLMFLSHISVFLPLFLPPFPLL